MSSEWMPHGADENEATTTMLKLYHYWSSVCSQKVRMCLAEKALSWQSHHVDIFRFENYEPWYTGLNPKAVVPTLDHDGRILIESNIILEYLEDNFPQTPLRPADLMPSSTTCSIRWS